MELSAAHFRVDRVLLVLVAGILLISSTEGQTCKFGSGCTFSCHCKSGDQCDQDTGQCAAGCDDGSPAFNYDRGAWWGPGCQIGNVAYQKTTSQPGGSEYPGYLAVSGNTNQNLDGGKNCALPKGSRDIPAWWRVDLGQEHLIYNVTVLDRNDCCQKHMWPGRWYVRVGNNPQMTSQTQCAFINGANTAYVQYRESERKFIIQCETPLRGQYVSIQKETDDGKHLFLCEVYVYGFQIGACNSNWGPGCLKPCNCEQQCDGVTGRCSSQCSPGWQKNTDDICLQECQDGRWGSDCRESCNCLDTNEACGKSNGFCSSGCREGYTGTGCNVLKQLPELTRRPLVTSATSSSVELEFQQWESNMGGDEAAVSYVILYRTSGKVTWIKGISVQHTQDGTNVRHIQGGLQPDTWYEFTVVPITADGKEGKMSPVETSRTTQTTKTTTTATTTTTAATATTANAVSGTNPAPGENGGSNAGLIAGVVVSVLVLVAVAVVVVIILKRRRGQKQAPKRMRKEDIVIVNDMNGNVNGNVNQAAEDDDEDLSEDIKKDEFAEMEEGIENKAFIEPFGQGGDEKKVDNEVENDKGSELPPLAEDKIYQNIGPNVIHVDDLGAWIEKKKGEKDGFKNEYQELPQGAIAKWEVGNTTHNKSKNRFVNIRAYDHSRVILAKEDGDEHSDYINANYVEGYKDVSRHYIACQELYVIVDTGPKKPTINDMWRLIWQTNANRVVTVTNLVELAKTKCEEYWPNIGSIEYGKITVSLISSEKFADFTIRTFAVTKEDQSRTVRQFHFTSWPDHGVPSYATALLEFRRRVRSFDNQATGPMIVHCSAGIGRTGTFLAVDYLLDQAKVEQQVDIFTYVYIMRRARFNMIQTQDQYVFVYDALLEALRSGDTVIPCSQFQEVFKELDQPDESGRTKLQEQFEILNILKAMKKDEKLAGLDAKNIGRNRDTDIVPSNRVRPFLATRVDGTTDYINAVFIDGYKVKHAYLVTQSPLPNTKADIWRLAYDHRCRSIIVVNNIGEEESCPVYWPDMPDAVEEGEEASPVAGKLLFSPLEVTAVSVDSSVEGIAVREFQIDNIKKPKEDPTIVKVFQLKCWPSEEALPTSGTTILELLELVERWQQQTANGPIITQCFNGAGRSGLIISTMYLLDKLKVDQEVDVFQTVKFIRLNRPQLVGNLEQYRFLHELAGEYMAKYDLYANFK